MAEMDNGPSVSERPKPEELSEFARRLAGFEDTHLLSESGPSSESYKPKYLTRLQKFSFGLGHVINDIMCVLWFSYALTFLQIVVRLRPAVSASLLFFGQIVDAASTPFIGMLIDRFGSKRNWNTLGVTLTSISFPFIFHMWYDTSWRTIFYYAVAIAVFQLGWAIVQISHLSLIPEMTIFLQERADLTMLRYTFFVGSNILIYVLAFFVLRESQSMDANRPIIGPRDAWKFEVVALIAVLIGVACSTIFQCVLQTPAKPNAGHSSFDEKVQRWKKICSICRSTKLYLVALLHTTSRVSHSLNLVYLPFFINETRVRSAGILAVAPLLNFIAALLAAIYVNTTSKLYPNQKILFVIGTAFGLMNCVSIYFHPDDQDDPEYIYAASIFCGIGSALTIVTSLCIAANFIGNDTAYGAFIYSLITFLEKISNGILIFIIEYLKHIDLISTNHYYKFVLTFINGVLALSGCLVLMLLPSSICQSL